MANFSSDAGGDDGGRPPTGTGGYDRVKVPGEDGQSKVLSRAEFEALPLPQRVRHLMGGKLVFYRDGVEVPARDALRHS